jgi:hypothetical protein
MCRPRRLSRRRAGKVLAAAIATALAGARAARAAGPYVGTFVDAHAHLKSGLGPAIDDLIALYDGAGVTGALLFGEPWSVATDARDRYPGRIIPILAEGYADALHPDSSYVNPSGLEQLLAGGFVRGLGEVIARHSPFQLGAAGGFYAAPANNVPADHPALLEAYRVAGRYGAPVTIHQEWWFAAELERAVQAVPETIFVWAHAGHGGPEAVRPLLARNPNLLADLSARTPWLGPGTVLLDATGALTPEWASTLSTYPDRFLVGLDLFVTPHYQSSYLNPMVAYYRALLGQLDPAVAEQIGYRNAGRIASAAG